MLRLNKNCKLRTPETLQGFWWDWPGEQCPLRLGRNGRAWPPPVPGPAPSQGPEDGLE